MRLNGFELKKKIDIAKKKHKQGKLEEANNIYKVLITSNQDSFDLLYSYSLFCKDLKNFKLAKQLFLTLIKKFPKSINSYILLAEILRIENRFNEAEKVLLNARQIDPNHCDLIYNLSLLYFSARKYKFAIKYIDKAINLSNQIDVYKILKSEILINQFQHEEALEILNKLVLINDKNKQIRVKLLIANIFIKQKKFDEAEIILIEILKINNKFLLAYLNLSILYFSKKQLNKGIEILKKGILIAPNYLPFHLNLAVFYKNLGEINLAIKTHLFILSKDKYNYNSYFELSSLYDFKDHQNELTFLINTDVNNLASTSKIHAAFAISNVHHKNCDFDKSAFYLNIANSESLKLYKSDFHLKVKTAEYFRSLNIQALDSKVPLDGNEYIFIVGMPRSGSTLLENILSLNKEVIDMGEVNYLEESLKENKILDKVYRSYKEKIGRYYQLPSVFTDKNLFNYMYCSVIYNYFPRAKIIHCMRNPLDNILSIFRANFLHQPFSFSLRDISNLYINHYKIMEEYKNKYGDIVFEYNYEELVQNPNSVIPEIINWLGWEWDDNYLSPHKNRRNVFTASNVQIRKKINTSSINIWRKYKELLAPAIEIINSDKVLKSKFNLEY